MRCVVSVAMICFAALAVADDIEFGKVRSDLKLVQEVGRFRQRIRLTGTTVNQDAQWAKVVQDFEETFFAFKLEIDGKVKDVSWSDGWVRIGFVTKSDFGKNAIALAGIDLLSVLSFRVPRADVVDIKSGDHIHVEADVYWQRGALMPIVGPGRPLSAVGFARLHHSLAKNRTHLNGSFLSNHYVAIIRKQEFVFDKMEYIREQGGQSGPQPGTRLPFGE